MALGTLFVVATPIGNLEDITLRALRVLRDVDIIAAEDTRRTAKLLAHNAISTATVSFHEHNARTRLPQLVARLRGGAQVAVVSDAGTPGVSDPGMELVQACIAEGIPVEPVPGVSALLTAAVVSGFPLVPLSFWGFAPYRSKDRNSWLMELSETIHTCVFFDAPHRIAATLRDASRVLGDRPIMVGRELTKLHQEFIRGTAETIAAGLGAPRGEFTVVVGPRSQRMVSTSASDHEIGVEFGRVTENLGVTRRQAIGLVAKRFGKSPNEVYLAVERLKTATRGASD